MPRENRSYKRKGQHRDCSLIILAVEGEKREKQYFQAINEGLPAKIKSRFKLRQVDHIAPGHSAPHHLIQAVEKYKTTKGVKIKPTDHVFIVCDRDPQNQNNKQISDVATLCKTKGYSLALSNPCFEAWLTLYHKCSSAYSNAQLRKFEASPTEMKAELHSLTKGVNWVDIEDSKFWEKHSLAFQRANALDNKRQRWPQSFGSRVYYIFDILELT